MSGNTAAIEQKPEGAPMVLRRTILIRNQRVDPPWMAIKARRLDENGQPAAD